MFSCLSLQTATFIFQKILLDDDGLTYVCATAERFFAVRRVLDMMFESHDKQPTPRLLKFIIPCYARLSDDRRLVEQFHHLEYAFSLNNVSNLYECMCIFLISNQTNFVLKQGRHYISKLSS